MDSSECGSQYSWFIVLITSWFHVGSTFCSTWVWHLFIPFPVLPKILALSSIFPFEEGVGFQFITLIHCIFVYFRDFWSFCRIYPRCTGGMKRSASFWLKLTDWNMHLQMHQITTNDKNQMRRETCKCESSNFSSVLKFLSL